MCVVIFKALPSIFFFHPKSLNRRQLRFLWLPLTFFCYCGYWLVVAAVSLSHNLCPLTDRSRQPFCLLVSQQSWVREREFPFYLWKIDVSQKYLLLQIFIYSEAVLPWSIIALKKSDVKTKMISMNIWVWRRPCCVHHAIDRYVTLGHCPAKCFF